MTWVCLKCGWEGENPRQEFHPEGRDVYYFCPKCGAYEEDLTSKEFYDKIVAHSQRSIKKTIEKEVRNV